MEAGRARRYLMYATGEILLIVMGILIALAIDALYDRIQNAKTEQNYIQSILVDINDTKNQFKAVEQMNSEGIRSVVKLIEAFSNPNIQGSDSIYYWFGRARVIDNPVPNLNTMDILISTGDLSLIKSTALKTKITQWRSYVKDYWLLPLYDLEQEHRNLYRDLIREVDQFQLHRPMTTSADSLFPIQPPALSPFPINIQAYFNNRDNYAKLSAFYKLKIIMANYRIVMLREAEKIEDLLQSVEY